MTRRPPASGGTAPGAVPRIPTVPGARPPARPASPHPPGAAPRRRLAGPGEPQAPGRVRRQLIQQPVARAAADDPHFGDALAGQLLEPPEHEAILHREALEDRARELGAAGRLGLPGLPAERGDG